jgi:hypothetical protein
MAMTSHEALTFPAADRYALVVLASLFYYYNYYYNFFSLFPGGRDFNASPPCPGAGGSHRMRTALVPWQGERRKRKKSRRGHTPLLNQHSPPQP